VFLKLFGMNEATLMRGRRMVGEGQPAAITRWTALVLRRLVV